MSPVRRLLGYARRYRRDFLLGLASVVIATAISLASPLVLRYAVDDLTRGVTRTKLFEYGALLLAIGVVGGVFRFLMRRILIGASRHIEYDMRNDFFAHLEKLPLSYFQTHRTGDLMSRATNDLNAVRMMIGPSVMYSANTLLTFVVALTMMVSIDPRLTLLSLIPLPFASFSVKYFGSAIHQAGSSRFRPSWPRSAPSRRKRSRACAWCARTGRKPPRWRASRRPTTNTCGATGG